MADSKYQPVQLVKKHCRDCAMLNGLNGDQPWCLPEQITDSFSIDREKRVGRDLTGRRNRKAGHTWMVFSCSDHQCPARLAILWAHAERMLGLSAADWKGTE